MWLKVVIAFFCVVGVVDFASWFFPSDTAQEEEEYEEVALQDCEPQIKEVVVEKIIKEKVPVKIGAKTKKPVKNSKLNAISQKISPEAFDKEFIENEKSIESIVQEELRRDIPSGTLSKEQRMPNGWTLAEFVGPNGKPVFKQFDRNNQLRNARWQNSDGEFHERQFGSNGQVLSLSMGDNIGEKVAIQYSDDGKVLEKSIRSKKNQDLLIVSYDDNGEPIMKSRHTKEGHILNVWESEIDE